MALFNWSDEYSVSVLAMDNHHKKLFDIMNQMHDAMKSGTDEDVLAKFITELVDYTKYHFGEEERMLEQVHYSGIDSQKRAHVAFVDKITEYKNEADGGMAIFAVPKVSRLGIDWLKEHIISMDTKYSDEANAGGFR
ncbi:MAG: bacteriohemerythrin [Gammaproteobacteria bacterium]|nr:bacteriohemerythrin [Gammaproteobacteria bacterium]